jgi:phosphate uptake regulator
MKRKIIRQGHNTLTLTLPSKWAEKFNIKAGDEVDLTEQGKDLKISVEKKGNGEEIALIDISGLIVPMVWRLISSVYRAGYNEVKISFEAKSFRDVYTSFTYNTIQVLKDGGEEQLSPLEAIQALVNRFIGFEIIEQKTNYCIIKDLGNTNLKEFDNTLRRIFLLLQTMSEAVLNNIKDDKKEELKGVHIIDTNIDRFEDFCLRVLNKEGYSDFKKTPTMYSLILLLEMVGDEYKKLGLHLLKFKRPKNKNIIKFATYSDTMLKLFYDLYYDFSNKKAEQIYKTDKEYAELFEKVYTDLTPEESELLHHLKKINIFMLSLTELRIDLAY